MKKSSIFPLVLFLSLTATLSAQTGYSFSTMAGVPLEGGSADGTGANAKFGELDGTAVDPAGNIYVADTRNHTIRKITPGGVVTTLAGQAGTYGSTDGTGAAARFYLPAGIAVDGAGNVYVADSANNTIRKITSGGVVTTLAGLAGTSGNTDGSGSSARFNTPSDVAVDGTGNVYVTVPSANTIRKITPDGVVTTFAGMVGASGSADGTGSDARFFEPRGIAADSTGNLYVADSINDTIRKISPNGVVTTLAGMARVYGSTDGTGTGARFDSPSGVAVDGAGNVYVADNGNITIRKITSGGVVTTLAGPPLHFGSTAGAGTSALFNGPRDVAVDTAGSVYVSDSGNRTIRKITPGGTVTTLAGAASVGSADGTGASAQFYYPTCVAVDGAGNVYLVDYYNNTIRKITPGGAVTTLAGLAPAWGSTDGPAPGARFRHPNGIAVDGGGNVYVADTENHTIRKITPGGVVSTLAGLALASGSADGTGSGARFNTPCGVAVDSAGNVYVADTLNESIRMITPGGVVTTLAGPGGPAYGDTDGTGSGARFNQPTGVAVDGAGNVYVADNYNHRIRKITAGGVVTTLAGSFDGSADGTGTNARFGILRGIAVDGAGNLYVADTSNNLIRKVTAGGVVTTLAGAAPPAPGGSADGAGGNARFSLPYGVAVDVSGNLYVADYGNNTIRKGVLLAAPAITTQPASQTVTAGSSVTFTAAASGSPTPTYQWQKGGASLNGATNAAFTIASVAAGDAGSYTFTATNSAGSATSSVATLTVLTGRLGNETVTTGHGVTFSAANASGSIQWQVSTNGTTWTNLANGGPYSGVSTSSLVITNADASLNGLRYRFVATDNGSVSNSPAVTLTVAQAFFPFPTSIAVDSAGNLFVGDANANTVQKITSAGTVSLLAGASGTSGTSDGTGATARFNQPNGLVLLANGTLVVSDTANATLRSITSGGTVTTLAGSSTSRGNTDGAGTAATFSLPIGIARDAIGVLFVADAMNHTIRKITAAGAVTTLAGSAGVTGFADGTGAAARFNYPSGIAVDNTGTIYIADTTNNLIRKITVAGVVTTLAGVQNVAGYDDGTGTGALFNHPGGLTVDAAGNLYLADTDNSTIRKITSAGAVTTIAGVPTIAGLENGNGSFALFNHPQAVSVDANGNLFVVDTGNAAIRKIDTNGSVSTLALAAEAAPTPTPTPPPTPTPTPTPTPAPSGSGGGGAPTLWFIAALAALAFGRRLFRQAPC